LKERLYADTNLFIRFLTNEPPDQAEKARRLLRNISNGKYELYICDLVTAEIIYVLESVYHLTKKEVAEKLLAIAEHENVIMENQTIILNALELYTEKNLDFTDAYLVCHALKSGYDKICTFDEDFKKVNLIKMHNP